METIGIGITTRNRLELVQRCVLMIKQFSKFDKLIVIDDASEIPVELPDTEVFRFDEQQGIAKAKNKCLSYLKECDHIFLFDDDCWPIKDGWQEHYIDTSIRTKCYHFCYTWVASKFFEILEYKKSYILDIGDDNPIIIDYIMRDTDVRVMKVRKGIPLTLPYTITEICPNETVKTVKIHLHPNGVMLYISKKCIDKVGGFDERYGLYGGEHVDFSTRIHNCGLTPYGKFLDVVNSDQFFYAVDKEDRNATSTIDLDYRINNGKIIDKLLETEQHSTKYIQIY